MVPKVQAVVCYSKETFFMKHSGFDKSGVVNFFQFPLVDPSWKWICLRVALLNQRLSGISGHSTDLMVELYP